MSAAVFLQQKDKIARVKEVGTSVTNKQEITQIKHEICDDDMICRVCTNPADTLLSGSLNLDTTLMSAIQTVANITINETDNYPKYICTTCLDDLKIAYNFKRRCEESDMKFRKAMPSEILIETNSKLIETHASSLILDPMKHKTLESQIIKTEQSNIDNMIDTNNGADTKEEISWDNINNDENILESDNSCDNEGISSLVTKFRQSIKETTLTKFNKSDTKTKNQKVITKAKENNETRNKISRINKLLKRNNKEIELNIKIKEMGTVEKFYECKSCELKFDTRTKCDAHRRKNNCLLPCPHCGKLVRNLPMHEKTVHIRADKYPCDQCGKIYYSLGALKNHSYIHQNTMYWCDLCSYKTKRRQYFISHVKIHTGERKYLCAKCPASFTNCSNLRKHQAVHYEKKFECSKCEKKFRQPKSLKNHFDYAHLNVRYRCSICHKELRNRTDLLKHELRMHKREKHKLFENEQQIISNNE